MSEITEHKDHGEQA